MSSRLLAPTLLSALLLAALGCSPASRPSVSAGPRLVVLIVADQFRADYLDRFGPLLTGGLGRLFGEGVVFSRAVHDHARTQTAPGYATLATGVVPRRHGIIGNRWYDPAAEEWTSAVDDSDEPSPALLLAPTLGDWLRRARPGARVVSAAGKDRAAVMLGGHDADGAFWISASEGTFETSDYYHDDDPDWLVEFNRRRLLDERLGRPWEPLPVAPEVLKALGIEAFDQGPLVGFLPHLAGAADPGPSRAFYEDLYDSPWLDDYLERFAEHLVGVYDLGGDAVPDLLALGFSAADLVGHRFGPDSRELLDTVLRLDRTLERLLEFLDRRVGLEHTLIVLSADHGVAPVPEIRIRRGEPGGRPGMEEIVCVQGLSRRLAESFGPTAWLLPGPFFDRAAMARQRVSRAELETTARRELEACPAVERVWTRSELAPETPPDSETGRRFWNGFHPGRSPDLEMQFAPYFVNYRGQASNHGAPYAYDAEVPLLFWSSGTPARRIDDPVRTVDLAPTVAALLGVPPPPDLDGRDLLTDAAR